MTELDRAARKVLLREAQQLLEYATHLLTARQALREQAVAARASLGSRRREITVPSPTGAERSGSGPTREAVTTLTGQLLPFSAADASALHAVLDGEYIARAPQQFEAWLERRSEEHTSELQSRFELVCRLRHEKKN